jgi:hypothetical protein
LFPALLSVLVKTGELEVAVSTGVCDGVCETGVLGCCIGIVCGFVGAVCGVYVGLEGRDPPLTYAIEFGFVGAACSYFMLRIMVSSMIPAPANKKEYGCRERIVIRKL